MPLDKQNKKFRNNLLGQTVTLGLNLRLDPTLHAFELTGPSICVIGGGRTIPQSIFNALLDGPNDTKITVQELLNLANDALGGLALPSGVTYSDVGSAVSAINEVFDECRTAIPCDLF